MKYEKKYNDKGEVAVLISPGYGAGWSSYAEKEERDGLLFDSRLVDYVIDHGNEWLTDFARSLGYKSPVDSNQVKIQWLKKGTIFQIDCCEGFETIDIHYCSDMFFA